MDSKLKELTQKLYQEGIEEGKEKGNQIVKESESRAKNILEDAKNTAESIINTAKKEAEKIKVTAMHELELASKKVINELKDKISNLLLNNSFKNEKIISSKSIQDITKSILELWIKENNLNMQIVLSKEEEANLKNFIMTNFKNQLNKDISVNFSDEIKSGLVIKPKDNSYKIEFSESSLINFYKEHLKSFTKNLLFKD